MPDSRSVVTYVGGEPTGLQMYIIFQEIFCFLQIDVCMYACATRKLHVFRSRWAIGLSKRLDKRTQATVRTSPSAVSASLNRRTSCGYGLSGSSFVWHSSRKYSWMTADRLVFLSSQKTRRKARRVQELGVSMVEHTLFSVFIVIVNDERLLVKQFGQGGGGCFGIKSKLAINIQH